MPPPKRSLISKVQIETQQAHEGRVPLIQALEKHFEKKIVVFQTSFSFDNGLISDDDATMLEEVLLSSNIRENLLLIINSSGGFGLAAERITNVCRTYSRNGFEVLVPRMAKSAATIVCFGANKIWMGETSELGPIDPQLRLQRRGVSVYNVLKSYDTLLTKAGKAKGRIEPYLQQLQAYDPRYIQQLRQEMALSEAMAVQLLQGGMMKGKSKTYIKSHLRMFLDPAVTLEHGRPIYCPQARKCGLAINEIKVNDSIWDKVWELQLRYDYVLTRQYGKVVESVDDSFSAQGHYEDADPS
jgi:ClpP class serine protease